MRFALLFLEDDSPSSSSQSHAAFCHDIEIYMIIGFHVYDMSAHKWKERHIH
jgi:hypothetical protein